MRKSSVSNYSLTAICVLFVFSLFISGPIQAAGETTEPNYSDPDRILIPATVQINDPSDNSITFRANGVLILQRPTRFPLFRHYRARFVWNTDKATGSTPVGMPVGHSILDGYSNSIDLSHTSAAWKTLLFKKRWAYLQFAGDDSLRLGQLVLLNLVFTQIETTQTFMGMQSPIFSKTWKLTKAIGTYTKWALPETAEADARAATHTINMQQVQGAISPKGQPDNRTCWQQIAAHTLQQMAILGEHSMR